MQVKNSIGNVEAKELICMTHGHELKRGNVGGRGVQHGEKLKKKKKRKHGMCFHLFVFPSISFLILLGIIFRALVFYILG